MIIFLNYWGRDIVVEFNCKSQQSSRIIIACVPQFSVLLFISRLKKKMHSLSVKRGKIRYGSHREWTSSVFDIPTGNVWQFAWYNIRVKSNGWNKVLGDLVPNTGNDSKEAGNR